MLANGIWMIVFITNSLWGFIISALLIAVILVTNILMMMASFRSQVNWIEMIGIRGGLSIYTGWITAATIVNIAYMLKSLGMKEVGEVVTTYSNMLSSLMFMNEE